MGEGLLILIISTSAHYSKDWINRHIRMNSRYGLFERVYTSMEKDHSAPAQPTSNPGAARDCRLSSSSLLISHYTRHATQLTPTVPAHHLLSQSTHHLYLCYCYCYCYCLSALGQWTLLYLPTSPPQHPYHRRQPKPFTSHIGLRGAAQANRKPNQHWTVSLFQFPTSSTWIFSKHACPASF